MSGLAKIGIFVAFFTLFVLPIHALRADPRVLEIRRPEKSRNIVIPDIHADWARVKQVLEIHDVINSRGQWIAGNALVVFLGDLVDRGPDSFEVIDRVRELQRDAIASGGRVECLAANHEKTWTNGYHYFLSLEDQKKIRERFDTQLKSASAEQSARLKTLLSEGERFAAQYPDRKTLPELYALLRGTDLGAWISDRPLAVVVDGVLLSHADLSIEMMGSNLIELGQQARRAMQGDLGLIAMSEQEKAALNQRFMDPESLVFRRSQSVDREKRFAASIGKTPAEISALVDELEAEYQAYVRALESLGARLHVVGHTPVLNIQDTAWSASLQTRLIRLDGSMSSGMDNFGSWANALVWTTGAPRVELYQAPFRLNLPDAIFINRMVLTEEIVRDTVPAFDRSVYEPRGPGFTWDNIWEYFGHRIKRDAVVIEQLLDSIVQEQLSRSRFQQGAIPDFTVERRYPLAEIPLTELSASHPAYLNEFLKIQGSPRVTWGNARAKAAAKFQSPLLRIGRGTDWFYPAKYKRPKVTGFDVVLDPARPELLKAFCREIVQFPDAKP